MIYLSERLQHGETLSQAWANNNWELKWLQGNHTDFSLEGSGTSGKGKGKKRPRDDEGGSDRSWQSIADSVSAKYTKLLKSVEKNKRSKGSWDDEYTKKNGHAKPSGRDYWNGKGKGKKSGKKK